MSPYTCRGSRTLARTRRNKSSFRRPSWASGMIGMDRPSSKSCRPSGPIPSRPYVDHMDRVGEQHDGFATIEAWCHHRDVVEMARGEPGVVGDVMVAGFIVASG